MVIPVIIQYRRSENLKRKASEVLASASKKAAVNENDGFESDGTMEYCLSQLEIPEAEQPQQPQQVIIAASEAIKPAPAYNFSNCNVYIYKQ